MTHPPDEHTPGTGAGRSYSQEFVDQPRVARQLAASGSSDNTAGMRCAASGDAGRRKQCQSFGSQSTCAQDNARAPLRNRGLCHTVITSALAYASRAPTVARANIPFLRRALAHPVVDGDIGRREGREAVDVTAPCVAELTVGVLVLTACHIVMARLDAWCAATVACRSIMVELIAPIACCPRCCLAGC